MTKNQRQKTRMWRVVWIDVLGGEHTTTFEGQKHEDARSILARFMNTALHEACLRGQAESVERIIPVNDENTEGNNVKW